MHRSWFLHWRRVSGRFFAGFFEGPRLGSSGEPLRDDLLWLDAPEEETQGELAQANQVQQPVNDLTAQLAGLMTHLGEPVKPTRES